MIVSVQSLHIIPNFLDNPSDCFPLMLSAVFDDPERYEHDGFYEEDTDYEDEYEAEDVYKRQVPS